ncbi:DUF58 domain-containing protein [Flavilitoribacter nigricans]|uniref:DUF58 domain-containing protein n=1 Tax=Flavilitoribacter nigricans (strain ATCC 23147 / DSM 23189 / NBRC 102662 / NCIMB 1420 / SS-2) TaxID=1122177 RepID=A0A2D0NDR3_FLAN2|nr:DUF58 domain-containing protein [Flavilitoribacter nigricans]PHN06651.1 DUF58 domain-containing protein [Flavilitoribacter nigricans DSM 23189 = NBRC 102662]
MTKDLQQLLKPEILHTIDGLELVARIIVEGFMSGSNPSQSIGIGQEFSQYRSYEPGDDLRQLDWKMYARSERYFIKQSEIETNITVKFFIDASHSMDHTEEGMSKLLYAKMMAAALAYLARKQGDTYGLYSVNERDVHTVRPRYEQQQFMRFLHTMVKVRAESTWKANRQLEHLYNHHNKEMILFFTDMYDAEEDLLEFIKRLKTPRNEVIVFHLMGRHELLLDQSRSLTFEDLETGERLKIDTDSQQQAYRERLGNWLQGVKDWMLQKQINYQLVRMNEPLEPLLRDFLKIRKTMIR